MRQTSTARQKYQAIRQEFSVDSDQVVGVRFVNSANQSGYIFIVVINNRLKLHAIPFDGYTNDSIFAIEHHQNLSIWPSVCSHEPSFNINNHVV